MMPDQVGLMFDFIFKEGAFLADSIPKFEDER